MEIEQLNALAEFTLQHGVKTMQGGGGVYPMFTLVRAGGEETIEVIAIDGPTMDSEDRKAALAAQIQGRVDAGELQAVIFLSDAVQTKITQRNEVIRQALGLSTEQAAQAGLCERADVLSVFLDSPIHRRTLQQAYSRSGTGELQLGKLLDVGENMERVGGMNGRFFNFFKRDEVKAQ